MTHKNNSSIHNVCIASIKRRTTKPYDFKWTKFYETNEQYFTINHAISLQLLENELVISSTIIDNNHYNILTTRRLFSMENSILRSIHITNVQDKGYGLFKDYNNEGGWTYGKVEEANGEVFNYYIETGFASMVMIYGVRTVLEFSHLTQEGFDKQIKRLAKSGLLDSVPAPSLKDLS